MSKATQLSFNGGEFTEFMDARVDLAKYSKGCRTLENMNLLPYGAAVARSGTKFGGEVRDSSVPARLIPFVFSDTTTFHLEMSKDAIRIWSNESILLVPFTQSPVEAVVQEKIGGILQEYDDVWDMQFEQINDVVFYTAPNQPLKKIVRYADDDWRVELERFDITPYQKHPPMGRLELDKTVTISDDAITAGAQRVSMTATGFTFDEFVDVANDDTLREIFIIEYGSYSTRAIYASSPNYLAVDGAYNVTTSGVGQRRHTTSVSEDGGITYEETVNQLVTGTKKNFVFNRTAFLPSMVKIKCSEVDGSFADYVTGDTSRFNVYVEVVDYVSPTEVLVDVLFPFEPNVRDKFTPSETPLKFKRQAYRKGIGFPTSVVIHRNRLCLARTNIHISTVGAYNNFHSTELSDSAFTVPLKKSGSPLVRWMKDLRELRIGMTSDEAVITTENLAEGFSFKNYYVRFDSSYGSLPMKPETVNGSLLFVTNDAEVLRNQVITGTENYYDANTLTTLADHILMSGVKQTGLQRQPYPTYKAVRNDGQLAQMLFEEAQNIQAWSRHVTDGSFKSVSVVPRPKGEDGEAYIVEREINGELKKYVEFKVNDMSKTLRDNDYSNIWFVDCGVKFEGTDMSFLDGLDHLEGKEVSILADGIEVPKRTVTDGSITLDSPANVVIVGLPYSYTLEPMNINSAEVMGQSKQIAAAIVYLRRSGEGYASVNGGLESRLKTGRDISGAGLHDGTTGKINVDSNWERETSITLRGESPLPLNIQNITLEYELGRK